MEQYTISNEMYENYMEGYSSAWEDYNSRVAEYKEEQLEAQVEYQSKFDEMQQEKQETESIYSIMFIIVIAVMALKLLTSIISMIGKSKAAASYNQDKIDNNMMMYQFNKQMMDQQMLNQQMLDQQNQEFMDFSLKSVTPFEHGGFEMNVGNSFNMDFGHGPGMF